MYSYPKLNFILSNNVCETWSSWAPCIFPNGHENKYMIVNIKNDSLGPSESFLHTLVVCGPPERHSRNREGLRGTQVSSSLIWILRTFNRLWDLELLALREPLLRPAHGRRCCQLWPLSLGVWWPGRNELICLCRYRSPGFHVQSWYDEVKDYTYPYPHECNPWCPERCSGAMCTHYTQVKLEEQAMTSA